MLEMQGNPIKNILFDLGNVLIDLHMPRFEEQVIKVFGRNYRDVYADLASVFEHFEKGNISEVLFINALVKYCGGNINANQIVHAWNSILGNIPVERLEMLLNLRQKYKVFLFSNTNCTHIDQLHRILVREHQLQDFEEKYFDKVYYSHKIHMCKPDPESFLYIAADAGIHPNETLFIDDLPQNIAGAASVGYHVMQHDPQKDITKILLQL